MIPINDLCIGDVVYVKMNGSVAVSKHTITDISIATVELEVWQDPVSYRWRTKNRYAIEDVQFLELLETR